MASGPSRMKKPCDCCKRYVNHVDEENQSMSCFLRRMTASPKHVMIVPNKFLKHFVGKLSQTIKLGSPNCCVFNVEVTECYNKMVLRDGWEKFVGAHHIEENDFLLFQHIENSIFKVVIFDSDGFEKPICCDCIKSIPSVGETRVDNVDISSSSQFDTVGSSGKLSSRRGETLKMTVTSSSSGGSGEDIPCDNESFESDDLQAPADMTSGPSRMKKPCDRCKRYVDHLDVENQSMSCFLRRMTASPKHVMIVPTKFLKHFEGKLSQTIKLESPNGSVYNVEVTEYYNKMVLRDGWEKFVGAHHIEENNFLLFQHIENSVFKVVIFDSDGFEKIICCDCIKNIPSVGETRVDNVDISSSTQFDTIGSSGILSGRHVENLKMTVTSSSSGGSGEDIPSDNESFESDDLQAPGADYIVPHRTCLSQEQKERVTLLIKEIQPKTTVYIAVMRKSHVHPPDPSLDIIKEYAFAYFPHGNTNVTLQTPGKGKKWHPELNTTKDSVYRIQGQWLDFVCDNHVQEGDICAFLPVKLGRRFTFTVYLLRAAATHSRSETGFQRAGPCPGVSIHIKEPTDGDHVSSESDMNEDSGSPSHPLYFLPSNSGLSKSQKKIVEERVQAIKSEVPIYVAIMRRSSLEMATVLELSYRYTTAVNLQAGRQTLVLRCGRNIWKTNLVTMRQRRYLCGGWGKFVRDNGLGIGDICLFELKKNERKLTMMVHIIPSKEPTDGEHVPSESDMNEDSGSSSHPLYFLPSNSGLSKSQQKIVEERVQAIKSEVPIYVAIMRQSNLGMSSSHGMSRRAPLLELGSRYATAVNLPAGVQTVVLWCGGKIWKTNITRQRRYLCGGWGKFVHDNGLGVGDICLFELKKNEQKLTMMVHIIPRKELYSL